MRENKRIYNKGKSDIPIWESVIIWSLQLNKTHGKTWEEEQIKPKSKQKEWYNKIRAEISKTENRKITQKIKETKEITNIRNQRGDITIYPKDINRIIKEYYEQP